MHHHGNERRTSVRAAGGWTVVGAALAVAMTACAVAARGDRARTEDARGDVVTNASPDVAPVPDAVARWCGGQDVGRPDLPPVDVAVACCAPSRVRGHVGVYGWMAGMDSRTTTDGTTLDADLSFAEILEQLDAGFMGDAGIAWDGWTLDARVMYIRMGEGAEIATRVGPLAIDTEVEQTMAWLAFGRDVICRDVAWGACPGRFTLNVFAGVRYYAADVRVTAANVGTFSQSNDWWDPLVGARAGWDVTPRLAVGLEGDVGGFGVGSDLAWHLRAGLEYRLSPRWVLHAGYNVVAWDYEDGSFAWDATLYGPYVGLEARF